MKRSSQIMTRKFFHVIDDVTEWTQNFHLYSCLGEVGSANKLQGQCLVNKCKYHNCLSRLYMPKDDISEEHLSRVQVKGQHHRLIEWPWHFNGHNSVNLGIIKMKQELKLRNSYSYVATATKIRFYFETLKIHRFLLKTHCKRRGWWYHVPYSSYPSVRLSCRTNWKRTNVGYV